VGRLLSWGWVWRHRSVHMWSGQHGTPAERLTGADWWRQAGRGRHSLNCTARPISPDPLKSAASCECRRSAPSTSRQSTRRARTAWHSSSYPTPSTHPMLLITSPEARTCREWGAMGWCGVGGGWGGGRWCVCVECLCGCGGNGRDETGVVSASAWATCAGRREDREDRERRGELMQSEAQATGESRRAAGGRAQVSR
jgi:hypothetical protein